MADAWPASLPPLPSIPSRSSFPRGVLRSENTVGPAKVRRISTANVEPWSFALVLPDETALIALRTFWDTTLSRGALPFEHTYFGTTREIRFVTEPAFDELGNDRYRVSMDLEVMP